MQMSSITQEKNLDSQGILSGPIDLELPDWFREQQRTAWSRFESLPRPARKDQPWRFSNIDLLDLKSFQIPGPLSEDDRKNILKYSIGLDHFAGRMIFANNQLVERSVVSEDLKK